MAVNNLKLDKDKLKEAFDLSHFDINAVLRGAQLTLVGAHRALQNPAIFNNAHYKQAIIAVGAGIAIRLALAVPVLGIRFSLYISSFIFDLDRTSWGDHLVNGLDLIANHVLQIPLFLMTLMRYVTPTLDDMFMDSLRWVDFTYVSKHKHENPDDLRDMYYPNLKQYKHKKDESKHSKKSRKGAEMFIWRFARKAGISLAVYVLSCVPYVGNLVLPLASFYTFNKAVGLGPAAAIFGVGIFLPKRYLVIFLQTYFASRSLMRELLEPYFARIPMDREQKRNWFRSREGLLFGFGVGFYILLRVPFFGVLIYGIAEASTAYLITKITDPPPPPGATAQEQDQFLAGQQVWKNKHEFLNLSLANLDTRRNGLRLDTPASEQPNLHNRWHPDIPFAGKIQDGETVKIECLDWTGGQISNNDSADDVQNIDLTRVHYLTGPFEVEGAQPGDVLLVEIMDVQPFEEQPWGFTGVFHKSNGGGFLDELYPSAAKAIWDFEGIFCTSRHIPHVKFSGLIHPGILGCAPSAEVLDTWNQREAGLIAANKLERQVALPPEPKNAHAGAAEASLKEKIGREGGRTIPGRPEHGGNCDIKNLSRGSRVYLPVHVPGAKFSVGDLHFSQGDGEISFCGAIEMAGVITVNFKVIKNGMADLGLKSPIYIPGPVEPQFGPGRHIYFEGFSVDEHGKQHYTRRRRDEMQGSGEWANHGIGCIEYLRRFGYNDYQTYLLMSSAPIQGHVAGIVDIPNACTTLGLPMDIFDFDISPSGPAEPLDMGTCAFGTGVAKGDVTAGGKNSEHSFGGGLTYKERTV
ncbi:formamidase [Xylaria nigripes]|nr:formamidase [Xylaria nigripes]